MSFFRKEKPDRIERIVNMVDRKKKNIMSYASKSESDYSDWSAKKKDKEKQIIAYLKMKLNGNTARDEINFLKGELVDAEIENMITDLKAIMDDIYSLYDEEQEEEWAHRRGDNRSQRDNLRNLGISKYMPLFREKLQALIKKYPEYESHINEQVFQIKKEFR